MKLGIVIALFTFGMVGLGFLADKGFVPEWVFPVIMVGGSFLMVYFVFLRGMLRTRRLMKHGRAAEATVLQRFDTGTTINKNPQVGLLLDVRPVSDPPFQAEARVLVSRLNPDAFPVGSKVKVRYDPKNLKHVAVDSEDTGLAQETAQKMVEEMAAEKQALKEHGEQARATIMRTWDLNVNVTGRDEKQGRLTGLLVEVDPDSGPKFEAEFKAVIQHESLNKYVVGTRLIVLYDPKDLRSVAIERREGA